MPANPYGMTGLAAGDLGFGDLLKGQVKDETDEERRRRETGTSMLQMPAAQMLLGGIGTGVRTF